MLLTLQRETATVKSTPGTLQVEGDPTVYRSLEPPPVPDPDEPNCPVCIDAGTYVIRTAHSLRFNARVPVLQNVPHRTQVEIHYGNWILDVASGKWDSEGCVLAGLWRSNADEILGTRSACIDHIWPAVCAAEDRGEEVRIEIHSVLTE